MRRIPVLVVMFAISASVFSQARTDAPQPKIIAWISELTSATGWIFNIESRWVSGRNMIPNYGTTTKPAGLDFITSEFTQGFDNFKSIKIGIIEIAGSQHFLFLKEYLVARKDGDGWKVEPEFQYAVIRFDDMAPLFKVPVDKYYVAKIVALAIGTSYGGDNDVLQRMISTSLTLSSAGAILVSCYHYSADSAMRFFIASHDYGNPRKSFYANYFFEPTFSQTMSILSKPEAFDHFYYELPIAGWFAFIEPMKPYIASAGK